MTNTERSERKRVRLAEPRQFTDWIRSDAVRAWYLVVTIAFVALVALGITTSSLGISYLRFDPESESGLLVGEPLAIRSDEWMRNTPLRLGIIHTGDDEYVTPLTEGASLLTGLQAGPAASVVFFDGTIARLGPVVPDRQLFALLWWLPFYGIAISVAYILRFFRVRPAIAAGTAALSVLAPAIAWWSLVAPMNVALVMSSAALMVWAYRTLTGPHTRWRIPLVAVSAFASGVLLARMPLAYPPWGIPLGLIALAPIAVALLWRRPHRAGFIVVGLVSLFALVLFADVVLENYAAYAGIADTAYPGVRRSAGGGVSLSYFLSAHFAGVYMADDLPLAGINQSEMATGLTLLSVVILGYAVASRTKLSEDVQPFVYTSAGALVALSAWALLPWPAWSASIPILNLLPPIRVAQVVGMGSLLLFGVVLDQVVGQSERGRLFSALAALLVALSMVVVGFSLRSTSMPDLTTTMIFLIAAVVALSVAASVDRRYYAAGMAGLVAVSLLATWLTNPVMAGLGDLRGGQFEAVRDLLSTATGDGYMAADDMFTNSMTEAAGLKSLSGEQATPSEQWLVLDPDREYMPAWNRGAIVLFEWNPDLTSPIIETPQADVLIVRASPCDERLGALGLSAITSVGVVEAPCLVAIGQFDWGQGSRWVYSIDG